MRTRAPAWLMLVASIAGATIGLIGVQSYLHHRHAAASDRALVETSSQLNAKLPMQVDRYTRLDTTVPGPGKRFTYMYTVSQLPTQSDPRQVLKALRPSLVNSYKTSPQLAEFRDYGIEMHYIYRDATGKYLGEIVLTPEDLR